MEQAVKSIVAAQFGRKVDAISVDTDLVEDLNGDSIDLVETLIRIEKELNVKISESELSSQGTKVQNLIELVTSKS